MLIERIRDAYRGIGGSIEKAETITTVPARRPAANAAHFDRGGTQARRLRRQRRLGRSEYRRVSGWAVRTW